jgi:hypothetical protein
MDVDSTQAEQEQEQDADRAGASSSSSSSPAAREFGDSTYSFFVYSPKDRVLSKFVLGVITLISQFVLLGIIIKEGHETLEKDEVNVSVEWWNCSDFSEYYKTFPPSELLQCEAKDVDLNAFYIALVFVSYFVAADFFASFKVLVFEGNIIAKLLVLFVLLENVMTIYAALVWAYVGAYQGDQYAAISNCIGVLFVNDLDGEIYGAAKVLFYEKKKTNGDVGCCGKLWNQCGPIILMVGFSVGMIVVGVICQTIFNDKGSAEFSASDSDRLEMYGYFYEGNVLNFTDPIKLCQKFVCAIDKTCCGDYYDTNPVCGGLRNTLCEGSVFNVTYV